MEKKITLTKSNPIGKHETINKSKIESMFNSMSIAVIAIDNDDGSLVFFNEKVCMDMEIDCYKMEGEHYRRVFTQDFSESYEKLAEDCQDGDAHTIIFYWSSKMIWEQVSGRLFDWKEDQKVILLTITNITEVAKAEYEYERLAYFDPITDLPNAKKLEEDVKKITDISSVGMIYFQIKGMYDINDLYGFDAGDSLVLQVRDWLLFSEKCKVELYRGSEGIIILGYNVTTDDIHRRSKEIIARFDRPWTVKIGDNEYSIYCNVRVGIVEGKYVKDEMRSILLRSLRAPANKDGFSIYNEDADNEAKNILVIRQTLINSVYSNMAGFSVSYQPIVKVGSEQWVGAEALCRWNTPDGKRIPPLKFIPYLEKLGLISKVDNWVRETAMNDCMIWGMDKRDFFLDVNFSSTQDIDDTFIAKLMINLRKTGYPPLKLSLEITESERMEFNEKNINGLNKLKGEGVTFSLDDFGTGYSSFENLINIPASNLKTEKVFLDDIETDSYKQYLLKMLIKLAHHLDLKIICEGVETEGQKELLEKYGADYMQGYLFSKPLERKDFEKNIEKYGNCPNS